MKNRYLKNCICCGIEFNTTNKKNRYCSSECKELGINKKQKEKFWIEYECENCGVKIERRISEYKKSKNHFCSNECAYEWRLNGEYLKCCICGKEFYRERSKIKDKEKVFCGRKCSSEYKKIELIGENNPLYNRVEVFCSWCGKPKYVTNSDYMEYETFFCNSECMGDYRRKEGRDKDYKFNKRKSQEHTNWRNNVFKRDNYTCIISGQVGNKINAHHIYNYSDNENNRFNLDNGVTLAEDIHKEFHSMYGVKNNTLEQFCDFYKYKTGNEFDTSQLVFY